MKKNHNYPQPSTDLYYLYCMNFECKISIYNYNVEIKIPLTASNLLTEHRCKCCHKALISPIDLEIKNVFSAMDAKHTDRPRYLDN